ncbi:hypothetical protein QUB70_24965 [Microcoleus sp. A003_D6]
MNESTVIILFVAANPSKDISRPSKKNYPKKGGNGERRSQLLEPSTDIKPRHLRASGFM